MTLTVANIILEQLGGQRFQAMTGAHSFTGDANSLTFKFPQVKASKLFACKVTLDPSDTYSVEFWAKQGKLNVTKAAEFSDVYADMLQGIFTSTTGLDTHL